MRPKRLQWTDEDGYHRASIQCGPCALEALIYRSWIDHRLRLSWHIRGGNMPTATREVESAETGKTLAQQQFDAWVLSLLEPCCGAECCGIEFDPEHPDGQYI